MKLRNVDSWHRVLIFRVLRRELLKNNVTRCAQDANIVKVTLLRLTLTKTSTRIHTSRRKHFYTHSLTRRQRNILHALKRRE